MQLSLYNHQASLFYNVSDVNFDTINWLIKKKLAFYPLYYPNTQSYKLYIRVGSPLEQ